MPRLNQVFDRFSDREKPIVVPIVRQSVSYHTLSPDGEGMLARHFFTEDGTVTALAIEIGIWAGKGELSIIRRNSTENQTIKILNPHAGRIDLENVEVKNGDKFYLHYQAQADGDMIGNVWTAFKFSTKG